MQHVMSKYATLVVHGDYKAANIVFAALLATLIGWTARQPPPWWISNTRATALGPAFDVAYVLYPDARGDFWDAEEDLLHAYHETLVERLVVECKGGPSSLSFDVFHALYDLVRIQLTFYWIAKGWVASTTGEAKLVQVLEEIDGGAVLASSQEYTSALERFHIQCRAAMSKTFFHL